MTRSSPVKEGKNISSRENTMCKSSEVRMSSEYFIKTVWLEHGKHKKRQCEIRLGSDRLESCRSW